MTNILESDREIDEYTVKRALNRHIRRSRGARRFSSKRARERANLAMRDGDRCFYCLRDFKLVPATIDHYFPEAFCRANGMPKVLWDNISNKVLACEDCNQLKSCAVPRIEYLTVWLNNIIDDVKANPEAIKYAKQFVLVPYFVMPNTAPENPLVDSEVLALDLWLERT
jgi:5-methylcytosine-specific restriction endonuclease McrA